MSNPPADESATPQDEPGKSSRLRPRWPLVLAGAAVWLAIWQGVAMAIGQPIIIASPWQVLQVLAQLVVRLSFWNTAWTTFWHIAAGFALAVIMGALLAWVASLHRWADALLSPPIRAMRSVPVVSFIILLLIWGGSSWLAMVVSCLMVLPAVFDNIAEGLANVPSELREMARVFRVPRWRTLVGVTMPSLWPYLIAACRVGIGLAWKSGVSAEVIGLPASTIGERLFTAKLYLATGDLFAWTVIIVALGLGTEKLVLWLLDRIMHRFEAVGL